VSLDSLKTRARFQKYRDFFCPKCGELLDFGRIRNGYFYPCAECGCFHIVKIDLRTMLPTRMDTLGSEIYMRERPVLKNQSLLLNWVEA